MRVGYKQHYRCVENHHVYDVTKERKFISVVPKDEDDGSGPRRTYETVVVDGSKPLTPQTGIDCMIGNISFAAKQGMEIEHKPVLLSIVGRGNPLDAAKFMDTAATGLGHYFAKLQESEKQDEEKTKDK